MVGRDEMQVGRKMQAMQNGFGAGILALMMAAMAVPGTALAQDAAEVSKLGKFVITLHPNDSFTKEDMGVLRMVATDKNALKLFVPQDGGFAALAASPADGFIKDGVPAASASALGNLPDAKSAADAALAACNAATKAKAACVILLEVAPIS